MIDEKAYALSSEKACAFSASDEIKKKDRALRIAARIMQAAGLCIYDDPMKCHRLISDATICDDCIRKWLLAKARKELKKENL